MADYAMLYKSAPNPYTCKVAFKYKVPFVIVARGGRIEVLGPAFSLAVRQQDFINRYQPKSFQNPQDRRNNNFDNPRTPAAPRTANTSNAAVFFQAQQPRMDHLDFMAAVLQKIHPTIRRFWQRNEMEALQPNQNQNQPKAWLA
jgi:hypothetical protein